MDILSWDLVRWLKAYVTLASKEWITFLNYTKMLCPQLLKKVVVRKNVNFWFIWTFEKMLLMILLMSASLISNHIWEIFLRISPNKCVIFPKTLFIIIRAVRLLGYLGACRLGFKKLGIIFETQLQSKCLL